MPETKSFYKSEKFYFLLFILLSAVGILINLPYCCDGMIKYDSSYQYALTLHPWKELWRLIMEDYSPPLYALLLKLVCVVFGHTLRVMRFTNSIVIVGLVFLSMFPVRKAFGTKTGFIAAVGFMHFRQFIPFQRDTSYISGIFFPDRNRRIRISCLF